MSGRPLRFLAGSAIAWTSWRAIMLWPHAVPIQVPLLTPQPVAAQGRAGAAPRAGGLLAVIVPAARAVAQAPVVATAAGAIPPNAIVRRGAMPGPGRIAAPVARLAATASPAPPVGQSAPPPGLHRTPKRHANRWSGSAWLVLRGGNTAPTGLTRGQLGGGQGGLRIAYALDRSLALVARITGPTHGQGREAAIGVEWQPTRLPVRLVAEQRAAIDGGRGGPALAAIGGFGPTPIADGLELETYAQCGAVRRARTEPFVEGAARLSRRVATAGPVPIDLGLGLSGGAQRDAARLDIGPSVGARVPLAGRSVRVSIDWRQRVAGDARPGSGLAFTIGSDF